MGELRALNASLLPRLTPCPSTPAHSEEYFDIYNEYWGSPTYGDDFVQAAYAADTVTFTTKSGDVVTLDFTSASNATRVQSFKKGAAYQIIWMYVLHENEDAISDCRSGFLSDNHGGVDAWDEGWMFYAGVTAPDGNMIYQLAEKRCADFATCTGDSDGDPSSGTALVNKKALDEWEAGKILLNPLLECEGAELHLNAIKVQMKIPLVQGMLKYAYKVANGAGDEELAEAWAFAMAILPLINECDSAVASTLIDNLKIGATTPMADGWTAVWEAVQSTFVCLDISCDDVGGYVDEYDATGTPSYHFAPCDDDTLSAASGLAPSLATMSLALAVGAILVAR